jgi:hypothetical protein
MTYLEMVERVRHLLDPELEFLDCLVLKLASDMAAIDENIAQKREALKAYEIAIAQLEVQLGETIQ